MPSSDDPSGLAERIQTEVQAVVARLAMLKADVNVLSDLAQGVAMTVAAAIPPPETPEGAPEGALGAEVIVGLAPEAA
ncbi:hypothetical protein [Rhodococcus sp. SGAir0479]|uniref:hypothetical protein n=1 Tax=Rhodococcus sp. SGAir0479 TaxID=2567884 RepID=UPI0010CCE190|nr:hypothetical protein [Rhodococcus sp. SGAir0479]QCQ89981.1 hypothetical protein E7742_01340 [Rhodococcus sp. SGAir0479]